jgi:hypothetical protein
MWGRGDTDGRGQRWRLACAARKEPAMVERGMGVDVARLVGGRMPLATGQARRTRVHGEEALAKARRQVLAGLRQGGRAGAVARGWGAWQ